MIEKYNKDNTKSIKTLSNINKKNEKHENTTSVTDGLHKGNVSSARKKVQHQRKDFLHSNNNSDLSHIAIAGDKKKLPTIPCVRSARTLNNKKSENDEKCEDKIQNKNEKCSVLMSEMNKPLLMIENQNLQKLDQDKIKLNTNQKDSLQTENKNETKKITKSENSLNVNKNEQKTETEEKNVVYVIPEVLRKQGTATLCSSNIDNICPCNTMEDIQQVSKKISYCDRRSWISVERMNELRKKAQEAVKLHKTFTIRGCFFSIRNALVTRGWVEKLDIHRKYSVNGICQTSYEDLTNTLPKRRPGESRRQYLIKCERNIMSRFLDHMPIDFLWTARKEKCDWIDQAKNPSMLINKFHSVPFTSKEGLCTQVRDFHWFYEEGISELYFPRCYNMWSPEELNEFIENFRLTGCIGFLKFIVEKYRHHNDSNVEEKRSVDDNDVKRCEEIFSENGKVPLNSIEFAFKRCTEFIDSCNHNDIDTENSTKIWDHDWDAFLTNHYILTHENAKIQPDSNKLIETTIKKAEKILENIKQFWPQFNLDGCLNIWIIKPANKCRGRGIYLMNNMKKILNMVNPSISTKSRFVVQKYIERPLIIHGTKFDIRQWFLVTSVQPLTIWMYKESYLRFSSQEYNLKDYHESVHLTNHAVQKKYRNGDRDKRLPNENMWDCYTFQAYLRQIGQHDMWENRIYPGMKHAITGTMLASQENMDRRANTFELFGADFMITEDFCPWLIEINSSPDLGATTSVTARMCPQCLEDTIKVIIDRKHDVKADTGNFELIYRQLIPLAPAYMGLNLFLKGKQISTKNFTARRERTMSSFYKQNFSSTTYLSTSSLIEKCSFSENHNSMLTANFCDDTILASSSHEDNNNSKNNNDIFKNTYLNFDDDNTSSNEKDNIDKKFIVSTSNNLISLEYDSSKKSTFVYPSSIKSPIILSLNTQKTLGPWKKVNEKNWCRPSDVNLKGSHMISRRHLSCGPRVTNLKCQDTDPLQINLDKIECENSIIVENSTKCVDNKTNLGNLSLTTDFNTKNIIYSPTITKSLSYQKQLCEFIHKSASVKLQKYDVKQQNLVKSKSSPAIHNTMAMTDNNSNYVYPDKYNQKAKSTIISKRRKSHNTLEQCSDYYLSDINLKNKMSLRTWKSKPHKYQKSSCDNSFNKFLHKKMPQHKLNGVHIDSPRRRLCKSVSKKLAENLGNNL